MSIVSQKLLLEWIVPETSKIIYKSKPSVLGKCQCGCNDDIPIRTVRGYLQRYKNGHSNRGRIFTDAWKKNISLAHLGDKSWNWKGGRSKDPEFLKVQYHEYYIKCINENPEKQRTKTTESLKRLRLKDPEYNKIPMREFRKRHPGYYTEKSRQFLKVLRRQLQDVLNQYECVYCSYMKVLHFDHINGDGKEDRKRFKSHVSMLRYYIKNQTEAKQKLQVLCANCNWDKKTLTDKEYRKLNNLVH